MSDYLDAELPVRGRDRMQRHIGECRECRRLLADLRVILERLHRLPPPSGGAGAVEVVTAVRVRLREPPSGQ